MHLLQHNQSFNVKLQIVVNSVAAVNIDVYKLILE